MGIVLAADERRHPAGPEELWNESYYFDWFAPDGSMGGYVRIGLYPNWDRAWYWACLVRPGRPLVTVIDHEVSLPSSQSSLEIRHDGIWADHVVEAPVEHMSINLESFGLEIDDPAAVYGEMRGVRMPFGFELDFETDRAAYRWPPIQDRYEIPCRVTGRVLVGQDELEVDGWGQRDHSWGSPRDWWSNRWCWSAGRLDDGTRFHGVGDFADGVDFGVAYVMGPGASTFEEFDRVGVVVAPGREGLPAGCTIEFGGLELEVEPLAFAPVSLTHHGDGRQARFPRCLARFTASDGRTGLGWIEWNQPPSG